MEDSIDANMLGTLVEKIEIIEQALDVQNTPESNPLPVVPGVSQ
jgi:hypothetical protein